MPTVKKNITKKEIIKKNTKNTLELSFDILDIPISENKVGNIVNEPEAIYIKHKEKKSTEKKIQIKKTETQFSINKPIFLQIHVANIYNIFGSGIIRSGIKPFTDVQSLVKNGFALSNGYFDILDESSLLLELTLSKIELSNIDILNDIGFYFIPLPISRIKRIYSLNARVKNEIVTSALSNDGGIIPERLIVPNFPSDLNKSEFKLHPSHNSINNKDFSYQLNQFDKILGCFAYLKNYGYLLANKTNSITTLPDHYFYAAQALNSVYDLQFIRQEKTNSFYQQLFKIKDVIESPLLKWLIERINKKESFTDDDSKEFGNLIIANSKNIEFVSASKEILDSLSKSLNRKNALNEIHLINDLDKFYLYLFALLRSYGNLNSENKTIARADLQDSVFINYGEFAFSILGYFFGYKTLRNFDDKILIKDSILSQFGKVPKRIPIKFELNNLFDYVIIESIYQKVFNSIDTLVDTSFISSDSIIKELTENNLPVPSNYEASTREIFGKQIISIKKKLVDDDFTVISKLLPNEIPVISEVGTFCFRNCIFKQSSKLGELISDPKRLPYVIYFNKEDILDAIKKNKIDSKELLQRIELSRKLKDF
jgi:hypothetical protein